MMHGSTNIKLEVVNYLQVNNYKTADIAKYMRLCTTNISYTGSMQAVKLHLCFHQLTQSGGKHSDTLVGMKIPRRREKIFMNLIR